MADNGYFSLAINIAVLPLAITGAKPATIFSSEGLPSANTATTPSDSGIVKL